jgi:ABC-type nitrate/sulfonate/bicarbonate transport system substrate-binding protein
MLQRDHPEVGRASTPTRSRALLRPVVSGQSIPASLIAALVISLFAAPATAQVADQELLEKHGVGIPEVTVRFGMSAFADHNIYSIGLKNGWLSEVGLSVTPEPFGVRSLSPQVIPRFLSGEVDIHTWYGPLQVEVMERVPHVKLFTFSDTYVGTYMLAAPNSGAKTVSELVEGGMPFEEAMTTVMAQLKDKRVGIDNTGSSRVFLDAIAELGGVTLDEVDLSVLEDARLVNLARGGNLDFVRPAGAAQNVILLQEGWYPAVSISDLIENLPPGDLRGIGSIGHTGLATTDEYYRENFDTILRMTGVMFRIIDAINDDLEKGTEHALALEVPVIEAAAGVELGVEGLRTIFTELDPLLSFEDQAGYWINYDNPNHYWNVYMPQIKSAQEGGLLPGDKRFIPEDAFTAPDVYRTLLRYRGWYDQMIGEAANLDGEHARLAEIAATHYANRNYLDAYRILNAALQ